MARTTNDPSVAAAKVERPGRVQRQKTSQKVQRDSSLSSDLVARLIAQVAGVTEHQAASISETLQAAGLITSIASDSKQTRLIGLLTQIVELTSEEAHPESGKKLPELSEALWGPAPEVDDLAAASANVRDQFAARRRIAEHGFTREQTAELLAISPQSVSSLLEAKKLIGIRVGREWRLPLWQFAADNEGGVVPNLDDLQNVFPGGRSVFLSGSSVQTRTSRDARRAMK